LPTAKLTRLRVAILGNSPDSDDWALALEGRSIEVVRPSDLDGLLRERPDLAIVSADAREARGVLERCSALPDAPALTLLVGGNGGPHPHTGLVRAVMRAKRDWESTFDVIDDPIAILGPDGVVSRANRGFARIAGLPVAEVVSRFHGELLPQPESGPCPISESLADGEARTREVEYAGTLGTRLVTIYPLDDVTGKGRLLVILKDVTQIKEQRELLFQAARLNDIGQLAGGVAHEINTPLASIALRAESLARAAEDAQLKRIDSFKNFPRYLKTIQEETLRCKKIISALLEFALSHKPEVRQTDLNGLCERAADLLRHEMGLKAIELRLDLAPDLPKIEADESRLSQALVALLMNALDFTQKEGHVSIETRRLGGDEVTLAVSDDGLGVAQENIDKIFQPFFTTKPTGVGTGLGLALAHGIVTAHGGRIDVESEPGAGTRFDVTLPVRRPAPPDRSTDAQP